MLTQSPASHKTSFQAERAPSLLDSYPGLRFKFNVREEKERGIKPEKPNTLGRKAIYWNEESRFIKTENHSLKLVN